MTRNNVINTKAEVWTEQDKQAFDLFMDLDNEQKDFVLWFLEYANAADPEKRQRMSDYVQQMEGTPINTAEDRAAFRASIEAI